MTPHFDFEEATASQTAAESGIINNPGNEEIKNIYRVASCLEQFHWLIGKITSWFRCKELNIAVGGASTSFHLSGEAIDFEPASHYGQMGVVETLQTLQLPFVRKVIIYDKTGHVHISFWPLGQSGRTQYLRKVNERYEVIG